MCSWASVPTPDRTVPYQGRYRDRLRQYCSGMANLLTAHSIELDRFAEKRYGYRRRAASSDIIAARTAWRRLVPTLNRKTNGAYDLFHGMAWRPARRGDGCPT